MKMIAGFECGLLDWNKHDLLETTGHLLSKSFALHYDIIKDHGMTEARDGLRKGSVMQSMLTASEKGVRVYWDLMHFNKIEDHLDWARFIASAHNEIDPDAELWVCPMNEPNLVPVMLTGMTKDDAVLIGLDMLLELKALIKNVKVLTVDAIESANADWGPTQAFSVFADIIGVNVYPHTLQDSISNILIEAHNRFRKPIMISETSWHDGFHAFEERIHNKEQWLRHVLSEVELAKQKGVDVYGICWYPIVDCPPWDYPESEERWSHGLIRKDLSVDPILSGYLKGI